jgi:hypothetical protein
MRRTAVHWLRLRAVLVIFAAIIAVLPDDRIVAAQESRGSIRGRITIEGPMPVQKVFVRLLVDGNFTHVQTVNAPRPYWISASVPGYVLSSPMPPVPRLRIGDEVNLHYIRGGIITGRVISEYGRPVVAAPVTAQRIRNLDGKPVGRLSSGGQGHTDDRGIYRIFGLSPGVYVVVVNHSKFGGNQPSAFDEDLPVYHPSSNRAEAGEVTVAAGAEASGIDIRYVRIGGHVISGAIETQYDLKRDFSSGLSVSLVQYPGGLSVGGGAVNVVGGSREFIIRGVPDGEYELRVGGLLNREERLTGPPQRVTVRGRDVSGVKLTAVPFGSIVGRIVVDVPSPAVVAACGSRSGGKLGDVVIRAGRIPVAGDTRSPFYFGTSSLSGDNGGFKLNNLQAGEHRLDISLPGERWYVRDLTGEVVRRRGYPVNFNRLPLRVNLGETLVGVKVTLGDGASKFEGKVELQGGGERVRVHLVPAEAAAIDDVPRYAEMMANREGRFRLQNLAPGRYRAVALRVEESTDEARIPSAWDAGERARLRTLAQTAGREVVLQPCRDVKDVILKPIQALK